ncbi:MAG: N-acetylmuramoyl-L-alanine amidase [Chloroflexi bacterium]|nr:N-acetylmuramoyl-L-alanine amidase [Chloroflexota bacterium]MCY4248041.1 N-acetylmuramoyl-L-alanine amidase [Chloroflexota bacterium]
MPVDEYGGNDSSDAQEPPASAIFAQIMRQAAAKAAPRRVRRPAPNFEESPSLEPEIEPPQIRRVRPRLPMPRSGSFASGFLGTIFVVVISTALVATLLMFFVDPEFLDPLVVQGLQLDRADIVNASLPTPAQTPVWMQRIGIISGHRGRDSGAICEDGFGNLLLREVDINFAVARRVVARLQARNYAVDMLDEVDPRLENYRAAALISIHANTCYDFGEYVSGYIVAISEARPRTGVDAFLRECIAINYGASVPLRRSFTLTEDLTNYHVWQKIHPLTPGTILEMGYMLADQATLTEDPDLLAEAITAGILCFIENAGTVPGSVASDASPGYIVPILATPTPVYFR